MAELKYARTPYSYSTGVAAGDFVFLGLHRGPAGNFTEQLHGTFEYLQETLRQFDLGLDSLVKVNVWLKYIQDLPTMEKLFHEYFPGGRFPARMTSTTEFIDADCLLMIDGVAYRGK